MALAAAIPLARAGTCTKDTHQVRLGKESVLRMADYLCRIDGDARPRFRVQFQRLTGLTPGAMLNGGSTPWSAILYGSQPRIVANPPLAGFKDLVARFGTPVREKDQGGGEQQTILLGTYSLAGAESGEIGTVNANRGQEIRSVRFPDLPGAPLIDETLAILTKPEWPETLSMYYGGSDVDSPLSAMTVWRYLSAADFQGYAGQVARYNSLVSDRQAFTRKGDNKAIGLLEHLTAKGWPDRFLFASAQIAGGEDTGCVMFDFGVSGFDLGMDVAVIENVSGQPLAIDQLLGSSAGEDRLTRLRDTPVRPGLAALDMPASTLAPAQRLIVPLNFVLAAKPSLVTDASKTESEAEYRKVASSKPKTVFATSIMSAVRGVPAGQSMFSLRKTKESFKPPSYPESADFAFGPEWSVGGLVTKGERIVFDPVKPNFLDMTTTIMAGSCPILYAWNGSDDAWSRRGKIIHEAQGWSKRRSETVTYDGLVDRFRIAEEELERATISDVSLTAELRDGTRVTLARQGHPIPDHDWLELYAGEEAEWTFVLPDGVDRGDVARSRLTVTGYYDRYPALLLSRR